MKTRIWFLSLVLALSGHAAADLAPQPRIVGGIPTAQGEAEFVVALLYASRALQADGETLEFGVFAGGGVAPFQGMITDCGLGDRTCPSARDSVCLIERGEIPFRDKVSNCRASGANAALIYNTRDSLFVGTLIAEDENEGEDFSDFPVLSLSRSDGLALRARSGASVQFSSVAPPAGTQSFCTASYIGNDLVVTAAHCLEGANVEDVYARVGGESLEEAGIAGQTLFEIVEIRLHSDYGVESVNSSDIAIVRLAATPTQEPIALMSEQEYQQALAQELETISYGYGEQGVRQPNESSGMEEASKELYEVGLALLPRAQCNSIYQQIFRTNQTQVDDSMSCTVNNGEAKGTCFGDSGGPVVVNINDQWRLLGVTSWGIGCGLANVPDVLAHVPAFRDDIEALRPLAPGVQGGSRFRIRSSVTDSADTSVNSGGGGATASWSLAVLALLWLGRRGRRGSNAS